MTVYRLFHKRLIERYHNENIYSTLVIGYYSSLERAQTTLERYKSIHGFVNYPNDFYIQEVKVDDDNTMMKPLTSIISVYHEYDEGDYEVLTFVGVYSTYKKAKQKINDLLKKPKYKNHPDGFQVAKEKIDRDGWTEGFDVWKNI